MSFYNTLKISQNEIFIFKSSTISSIKKLLMIPILIMGIVFPITLISSLQSKLSFFSIPISAAVIIFYYFSYFKATDDYDNLLHIDREKISYHGEIGNYKIPISSILEAEDKSIYYDFNGHGNRGWSHNIVLHFKDGAMIEKINKNGSTEEVICSERNDISMYDLGLNHEDYLKVVAFLNGIIHD